MEISEKTVAEPLIVGPRAIAETLDAMDLSSSGLQAAVESHGTRQAHAIKLTAREIAWNLVLPAEATNRASAEQAALATILALKPEHQILEVRTIVGPKDVPAPAGFKFDATATTAWIKIVDLARDLRKPTKLKRDRFILEGQVEVLALVLANSLGLTPFYWSKIATDFSR